MTQLFLSLLLAISPGQQLFEKRCTGCHALDRDKEGPRLAGVYGRRAGAVSTFGYSMALQQSKVTWTDATLNQWLADPDKFVPKSDMSFSVPSDADRRALIDYLKEISRHQ